jgi:hypothetical protein
MSVSWPRSVRTAAILSAISAVDPCLDPADTRMRLLSGLISPTSLGVSVELRRIGCGLHPSVEGIGTETTEGG